MKHTSYLLLCISLLPLFSAAQLINNGATIVMTPGTALTLNNISFQNDGVFNQTGGTVAFTGATPTVVNGNSVPAFYDIDFNKPGGTLSLQTDITINNGLLFIGGLLDLNGRVISLGTNGLLANESENSHIMGTSGYVQITQLLNAPSAINPGQLGATITSSQDLGLVNIRRGHQSQINNSGSGSSILRYYDIIPTNNTALNAFLHLEYLDAELNGLNENNLTIWRSNDNINWTNFGRVDNSTTLNYVEKNGINELARFTLSTIDNPLPLRWSSFNTQCLSGQVRVNWKTEQEQNTKSFTIKRSADGRNWIVITTVPAAGYSSSSIAYSYTDPQPLPGKSYYQVYQQDFDGRQTVSPVLLNQCDVEDGLKVYPNPTANTSWINIQSTRSSAIMLRLYDSKGALVQQRSENIQNGNNQLELHMDHVAKGIYSLVISWMDGKTKVVKVIRD